MLKNEDDVVMKDLSIRLIWIVKEDEETTDGLYER